MSPRNLDLGTTLNSICLIQDSGTDLDFGPDLSPKCLQRLSANTNSRQRVKAGSQ